MSRTDPACPLRSNRQTSQPNTHKPAEAGPLRSIATCTPNGRGTRHAKHPWCTAASRRSRPACPVWPSPTTWTSPSGPTVTRSPRWTWTRTDTPGCTCSTSQVTSLPWTTAVSAFPSCASYPASRSARRICGRPARPRPWSRPGPGGPDRILGSLHAVPYEGRLTATDDLFRQMPAADVMRRYLTELRRLVEGSDLFQVLAHLDFPRRMWPRAAGPYEEQAFEAEYRAVLSALAAGDRVLEVNTKSPLVSAGLLGLVAGGGGTGGLVRQRRASALAGGRPVRAGGGCGRGGGLPAWPRPIRLLAALTRSCGVDAAFGLSSAMLFA